MGIKLFYTYLTFDSLTKNIPFVRIVRCQMQRGVYMLNNEQVMIDACKDDPSVIFKIIKNGDFEIIERLIEENKINVNLEDGVGNDVVTRLLKAKQYDLVVQLMKKKNWDVNHQNKDGDTFGHILADDNSICAVKVVEELNKKKNYLPNIKNNKGETIFDKALNSSYLCTALKVLEDKRFNSIDISSFRTLCNSIIKNRDYGKFTKINSLEIALESLEKKELDPILKNLIGDLNDNMEVIKRDILNNDSRLLDNLINNN